MNKYPASEHHTADGLHHDIQKLMTEQPYGVLCTQGGGLPYGSVIAFTVNTHLNAALFTTPINTHKYRLLTECDQVALVIDNRAYGSTREDLGFDALTATGRAILLSKQADIATSKQSLLNKHPHMHGFIDSPNNAYFRIQIQRYVHVTRLSDVNEWFPPEWSECS
ncbi:MAG: pyridoxamine 5'-phosphate oxidase family protein [Gammaproteobacteria bacterium]|nr:pyridoxamine 5'-phosphate oxidase family protein [Gammaproteobacteria bacterium]